MDTARAAAIRLRMESASWCRSMLFARCCRMTSRSRVVRPCQCARRASPLPSEQLANGRSLARLVDAGCSIAARDIGCGDGRLPCARPLARNVNVEQIAVASDQ
jgi:hypothetical protein